jgi:hypothetical protein
MATQIVMDRTGDTAIHSTSMIARKSKGRAAFRELTGAGFTAAVGRARRATVSAFDPTAEETLFYPRSVGG